MKKTLVLLKPDCVVGGKLGEVLKRFEENGFQVCGCKMFRADRALLLEHYAHIASLPFFPHLETFMMSSPILALALAGKDAVARVRELLGPTDSKKAAPGTIRGDLGRDMMVNVAHASDSDENAAIELARFFREGEIFDYALTLPDGK